MYTPGKNKLFISTIATVIGLIFHTAFEASARATGVIQFTASAYSVSEDKANAVITVVRAGDPNGAATVDITANDSTAKAGVNYTYANQTLHFDDGQSTVTLNIPILHDNVAGENRTFNLVLSNPSANCTLARSTAVVTIIDIDIGLSFSTNNYTVVESNGNTLITVQRLGRTDESVSVNFATAAGTAQPGSIYQDTNCLLTFAPGQISIDVNVPILDNSVADGDVTVNLILSNPSAAAKLQSPSTAILTIRDNDLHRITTPDEAVLRSAIEAGGPIVVECDGIVYLTNYLEITRNVSIDASGHNFTISGSNSTRVLIVRTGVQFAMTNVTVADGYRCEPWESAGGAGLCNLGASVLVKCTFKNNHLDEPYGGSVASGGAIGGCNQLVLIGCSFINNVATRGNAIGGWITSGPIAMTNCTFFGNGTENSYLGTIYFRGDTSHYQSGGPIMVVNCTFAQNQGGALSLWEREGSRFNY